MASSSSSFDHARAISRWSYSDLQRQVSAATGRKGNVPYERAREFDPALQEHRFVDETYAAMRSGRFLLLIAGDGIREDVGAMTDLINRNAASGFSFGLVEVGLYGLEDGGLIVQPRTVAKTQLIERTVVVVRDGDHAELVVCDDSQPGDEAESFVDVLGESPKQAEYRRWWSPVLSLVFDDPDQEPLKLYYPNNVRTPLPYPKTWLLACRVGGGNGEVWVCTSGSGQQYYDMLNDLADEREDVLAELPAGAVFGKSDSLVRFSSKKTVSEFSDDDQMRNWVCETLNAYVNVLRPRLKRMQAGLNV